jgi:hypothetical protein
MSCCRSRFQYRTSKSHQSFLLSRNLNPYRFEIQRSRIRFPALQDFLHNSLERGPPNLVRINEELLKREVETPVYKTVIDDRGGSAALITRHASMRKSWH